MKCHEDISVQYCRSELYRAKKIQSFWIYLVCNIFGKNVGSRGREKILEQDTSKVIKEDD